MKQFNKFLAVVLPALPKWSVWVGARKYVAGKKFEDAVREVRRLNSWGFSATMDILGENIQTIEEARNAAENYFRLIDLIHQKKLKSGISLKLSQQGLALDEDKAWNIFFQIVTRAKEKNIFLRIDMEDSPWTEKTISFYQRAKKHYQRVGIVIQAYLYRSADDVEKIITQKDANLRICKGIYRESADIAIQDRKEINDNFEALVDLCLKNGVFVAIATHDLDLIDRCIKLIKKRKIKPHRYEFQALLGVPVTKTMKKLLADGHNVRYYVPFGEHWYAYSMRRLKENPDIAGYIFKDFFKITGA